MGKSDINRVTPVIDRRRKDTTPPDQLDVGSRRIRRHTGKRLYPAGLVHVVQVWTQVPHPRYGDRVPHFTRGYLPCVSDHRTTHECYVRRTARRKRS